MSSMQSKAGNRHVHNDGDQKTSQGAQDANPKFEAGQPNSHDVFDSKDERSLANTLAAASKAGREEDLQKQKVEDPLEPARSHGNEPSRGAQIDAELAKEDQETLKKMGIK